MHDGKKACKGIKQDGTRCQAAAMADSDFCFFHDPTMAEERREAQSFGGSQNRMKTLAGDTPDAKIEDGRDVVKLLATTINQVRRGEVDPRVANAVGYLANVLMKAAELGEMERRIVDLEALVKNRPNKFDLAMTGGS